MWLRRVQLKGAWLCSRFSGDSLPDSQFLLLVVLWFIYRSRALSGERRGSTEALEIMLKSKVRFLCVVLFLSTVLLAIIHCKCAKS